MGAWHCEGCSKTASEPGLEIGRQRRQSSDAIQGSKEVARDCQRHSVCQTEHSTGRGSLGEQP
eukprot:6450808-Amphidinium_carterae.1